MTMSTKVHTNEFDGGVFDIGLARFDTPIELIDSGRKVFKLCDNPTTDEITVEAVRALEGLTMVFDMEDGTVGFVRNDTSASYILDTFSIEVTPSDA